MWIYINYYQSLGIQIKNRYLCICYIWALGYMISTTQSVCSFSYNHLFPCAKMGIKPGLFVQWSHLHHQRANTKCISGFIEEKVSFHSGRSHPLSAGEWGSYLGLDPEERALTYRHRDTDIHLRNHLARQGDILPNKSWKTWGPDQALPFHHALQSPSLSIYFHRVCKLYLALL